MTLRLVALDLSLTGTGIAWTHNHHSQAGVGCSTVHTGTKRGHERIDAIWRAVAAAVKCQPHLVIVEGASFGSDGAAVDQLAGLRWIVKHWLWTRDLPYVEVAPATLKVYATGSGNATKRRVQESVTAAYGRLCHIATDDEADAVALLALGLDAYGAALVPLHVSQRRAVRSVKWPALVPPVGAVGVDPSPAGAKARIA